MSNKFYFCSKPKLLYNPLKLASVCTLKDIFYYDQLRGSKTVLVLNNVIQFQAFIINIRGVIKRLKEHIKLTTLLQVAGVTDARKLPLLSLVLQLTPCCITTTGHNVCELVYMCVSVYVCVCIGNAISQCTPNDVSVARFAIMSTL